MNASAPKPPRRPRDDGLTALLDPEDIAELPDFLAAEGYAMKPYATWGGMKILRCGKEGTYVLLGIFQPPEWKDLRDARRLLRIVTAMPSSWVWFWRRGAEHRLCLELIRSIRRWAAPAKDEPEAPPAGTTAEPRNGE